MCRPNQCVCVHVCLLSVFSFLALLEANTERESKWLSRRQQLLTTNQPTNSRSIFEIGSKMESINAGFHVPSLLPFPPNCFKFFLKIITETLYLIQSLLLCIRTIKITFLERKGFAGEYLALVSVLHLETSNSLIYPPVLSFNVSALKRTELRNSKWQYFLYIGFRALSHSCSLIVMYVTW